MPHERLVVDADFEAEGEPEDPADDLDAALDAELTALCRPTTDSEVSIAHWSGGDPVTAMHIADLWGERRARALKKLALIRGVHQAKLAVLDEWLAGYEEQAERKVAFADHLLDQYQFDFHAEDRTPKGGIVTRLPSAKLTRKRNKPKRAWDADAALAWQQEHYPEDVTQALSREAALTRLEQRGREYVDRETGEIVEFVRDVPPEEPESFKVEQEEAAD